MNYYKVSSRIPSSISLCLTINLLILYTVNLSKVIIKKRKQKTKQERKNETREMREMRFIAKTAIMLFWPFLSRIRFLQGIIYCTADSHTYTRTCRSTIYPGQEIVPGEPFTGFHREDITRRPPR